MDAKCMGTEVWNFSNGNNNFVFILITATKNKYRLYYFAWENNAMQKLELVKHLKIKKAEL